MRHVRLSLYPGLLMLLVMSCFSPSFSATSSTSASGDEVSIPLRSFGDHLLLVPVMINGQGPFEFAFDTGSSRTFLEPSLAAQLGLKQGGGEVVTSLIRSMDVRMARLDKIELASAAVKDMPVAIVPLPGLKAAHAPTRGILGEDFCSHFDFLLDNRHHKLTFERPANEVLRGLRGERLAVREQGEVEGQPTEHRLILAIQSPELGVSGLSFQIDSGASMPVLFQRLGIDFEEGRSSLVALATTAECDGCSAFRLRRLRILKIGKRLLSNVLMAMPNTKQQMDADGLLPTYLFQSIYISHSAGFVIVNPEKDRLASDGEQTKATPAAPTPGGF